MSTLGPDPAEGSDLPPKDNVEPNVTPAGNETTAEETTVTPAAADEEEETAEAPAADEDYAWGPPSVEPTAEQPTVAETTEQPALTDTAATPAAEEPADAPPEAELLVTPATQEPAGAPVAEEPAEIPFPHQPASTPADGIPVLSELARKPTLGQAIVMVTGILLFVWGFLPWYSDAGGSANAWSNETIPGLLLTATWVPLLSLAIAIFVAIKVFANGFPDKVFGFTWAQLSMVVGLIGVLISLGFLVANRSLGNLGSLNLGAGLILSFITSLVLLAGGVLDHVGAGTDVLSRPRGRVSQRRPR